MRAVRSAVAGVLLLLLLAGCTGIPTRGTVQAVPTEQANDPNLVFKPNPPADGADPLAIVQGFVYAATAGRPYRIAKEFLTDDFAKEWDPNAQVLVHDAAWTPEASGDGRVVLTVRTSGQVDEAGSYRSTSRQVSLPYQLTKVRGQWRIASAPKGVLLASNVFQKTFVPKTLQFFDPTWSRLVPDLRWFPQRADQTDAIIRGLLAGQSAPIAGAVTTSAFPAGTRFRGVTVTGAQTAVALTVDQDPDARTLQRMQQQLSGSLGVAQGQIRLIVNGRQAPSAPRLASPQTALNPVVLTDGRFGSLTEQGELREDTTLGKRIVAAKPTAVTVSSRQRLAAVLSAAGQVLIVTPDGQRAAPGGASIVTPDVQRTAPGGASIVAPSLDQQRWVYSVPAATPNGIVATNVDGTSVRLTPRLDGAGIADIEVSPDGTRLLVLEQTQDGTSNAFVAGILRATDGTPVGLTSAQYPIAVGGSSALSATWVTAATVAVLSNDADNQNQTVTQQPLGGLSSTLGPLSSAQELVGTSAPSDLRALLQNGVLFIRSGSTGWEQEFATPVEVSVLAVQR